nr:ATP-binding protein [uncultured Roseovarius sp.]
MTDFVNQNVVEFAVPLKDAHFPFPRGEELFEAMSWCVTDYYTKALIGKPFEARGIMVTGESRQGKSHEIDRLLQKFNDGSVVMPDGRPAKIIHCMLSGKITWKDMGKSILETLGYKISGRRTQADIWEMVIKYAKMQGVVGIHFDECQHVFTDTGHQTNQQILDSFKTLLKETRWPLMLILSGIPGLALQIAKEEQLAFLLRTVRFERIDLERLSDLEELIQLVYCYADKAKVDVAPLATRDFLERLAFAGCDRWGLVIELIIEAFTLCQLEGDDVCSKDRFSQAFAEQYSTPIGYSPFTMPNYQDSFDHKSLLKALEKKKEDDKVRPM